MTHSPKMASNIRKSARLMLAATSVFGLSCTVAQAQTTAPAFEIKPEPAAPVAAEPSPVEVVADSHSVTPVQSVGLIGAERSAVRGKTARFLAYTNYPAWVARGEIRVFEAAQSPDTVPLAVVPVDANGEARWRVPDDAPDGMFYVYRAYGAAGTFDETRAHELTAVDQPLADPGDASRPDFGSVDEAVRRNIAVTGANVTVTGRADPVRDIVRVSGQLVPISEDGRFVTRQIAPRGQSSVLVEIDRDGSVITRTTYSFAGPESDWFVVGHGDLTLGTSQGSGPTTTVSGDPAAAGDYISGRAAFYAKGAIGDGVTVTASIDTGEALVKDLFGNLDRKDPRQLLRRLDSTQYYPTYGDDSTLVEDAPTQGRFYLRVEKDDSRLIVGNFATAINEAELAQLDRGLFGALIDLKSSGTTSFGERKHQITAFASDPGTVPGRDEFRGTGGSLYFLKRQDISVGSERVRVEIRDRETGIVLESRELHPQQDYDFDPFQGRIALLRPLSSVAASDDTVRAGSSSGNVPVLVVRYEYTPAIASLDGYTVGGRAAGWLGDKVRLGVTAQRDTTATADQTLLGADILFRQTAGTYFKAEIAQTDGPGFGQSDSLDGGLTFTDLAAPGRRGGRAEAYRGELAVNFGELAGKIGDHGTASAYFERREAGFSSAGRLSDGETERWGIAADLPIGDLTRVSARYNYLSNDAAGTNETGTIDLTQKFAGGITGKLGLRYEDRGAGQLSQVLQTGERLDGAVEIGYSALNGNWSAYAFGQATLDRDTSRSENNRGGVGGRAELGERTSLSAELSGGTGGLGADVQLVQRLGQGSEAYINYGLNADRSDDGRSAQNLLTRANQGVLTLGARKRFSDSLSINGEQRITYGSDAPSLMRSFGLRFDPTGHLSFTGSFENGRIEDPATGTFRRTAATVGVGYTSDRIRAGTSLEARFERGSGRDQTVWLFRSAIDYRWQPDWHLVGRLNFAIADNDGTNVRAADYVEGVAGLAYRPTGNERVNGLLRYSYLQDTGPVGQVSGTGAVQNPKQVSQIVSLDVNYDLSSSLTLGVKYGYRGGRVSLSRGSENYVSSNAHLGVIRADYRIAGNWDIMIEGRVLDVTTADDTRFGALGAVYRHLGQNVKIGFGYSLSDFSDDLTDQSYTSHGPFINLIGKF